MNATKPAMFPFSAVVGHDDAKLALLLAAIDPAIGGVLLRGQKGSAKTTLARGLAALLPGDAPFVDLPLGATEDRLIGTLDLGAVLTGDGRRFEPGLLAAAHGGVLYVDEVNLLPDHLVDVLLDVAASGVNRVEREGISHEHAARFVLIGSMNPEEGELRPQLLDRFGLAVEVTTSTDPVDRAEAVRRRLDFDADPAGVAPRHASAEQELGTRLACTTAARVPDALMARVGALCAAAGVDGLRADLVITRAAAALAGWEGRDEATADDVRRVAPMALAHRQRRTPFDEPRENGIDEALDTLDQPDEADDRGASGTDPERVATPDLPPQRVVPLRASRAASEATGRRSPGDGSRGRLVGDRVPDGPLGAVAVAATARAVAERRARDPDGPAVCAEDLREARREQRTGNLLVLAVDASGSMGAPRRMEAVKGAVLGLLVDAYQRRDRVALVAFRGDGAEVLLRATGSVEVARARLADLPTGGRTPLAAGIDAALAVASSPANRGSGQRPLLVLVSDGRATAASAGDPVAAARRAAATVRARRVDAVVVDAENGAGRLGLAVELAEEMGARYLRLAELSAGALEHALREVIA
ncbi:MAG TPA: AAA family ATPase [Acidimicrobiia bacterium]|nr:AAA family ATPase [Acidimicrobiia bacterium]